MRPQSPVAWMVSSELPNELRKAEETARSQAALDREVLIEMQFVRGGMLKNDVRRAQVSEFFSSVQVTDLAGGFTLDFYPAQNAEPYWRDIMVRMLRAIRESATGISIERIEHASR
jgi:hypothetical protein